MLAIITLFIYVLKYPNLSTTQSDIALLDVGTGHFGQVHHSTSGHVCFHFPREVSVLANKATKQAAARITNNNSSTAVDEALAAVSGDADESTVSIAPATSLPIITLFNSLTLQGAAL